VTTRLTKSATASASQSDRARQRAAIWEPTGVDALEPEALLALRDEGSTAVTAGPGLPQSKGIVFFEAGEGKVHLTCKDVSV
jgi:hypothetical protein